MTQTWIRRYDVTIADLEDEQARLEREAERIWDELEEVDQEIRRRWEDGRAS